MQLYRKEVHLGLKLENCFYCSHFIHAIPACIQNNLESVLKVKGCSDIFIVRLHSGVFIINFEQISYTILVLPLLTFTK